MIGAGEYNLNVLNEIEVTDSYLGLDQTVRKCQDKEPFYNCTSKYYMNAIIEECGCVPLSIRLSTKVRYLNKTILVSIKIKTM